MPLSKSMKQELSGNEAKLEVDITSIFGAPISDVAVREAVAQEIIDLIIDNAKDAKFLNPPSAKNQTYSESYAESDDFKIAGKSKGNVNMTQTGDMLGLMTILSQSPYRITIGWKDRLQAQKAHGHITGNVGVTRNFLGLSDSDVSKIKSSIGNVLPKDPSNNEPTLLDALSVSFAKNESSTTKTFTAAELFSRIERGEDIV